MVGADIGGNWFASFSLAMRRTLRRWPGRVGEPRLPGRDEACRYGSVMVLTSESVAPPLSVTVNVTVRVPPEV